MNNTASAKEAVVRDILDSLPECSLSFDCTSWNYDKVRFDLYDKEDGKHYVLTLPKALEGFDKLTAEIDAGKFPGLSLSAGYKADAGQWDALSVDALLQMSVLGEVIYG